MAAYQFEGAGKGTKKTTKRTPRGSNTGTTTADYPYNPQGAVGSGRRYRTVNDPTIPQGYGGIEEGRNQITRYVGAGASPIAGLGDMDYTPSYYPGGGGGSGGGGGGGGGGGAAGPAPIDWASLERVMGYRPTDYTYADYTPEQYTGTGFYDFDPSVYNQARQGLDEGLAADLAAGRAAYGDARTELQQYQNPFANVDFATNQVGFSDAMQRMLDANQVAPDFMAADQAQGVQADQAFGNLLSMLGATADQRQGAELRALGGDERRLQESLRSQGRTMGLGIDMALAQARSQYEREKWQYGEQIAQRNYEARVQAAIANNQGRNEIAQANVTQANQARQNNLNAILELIAAGRTPPESLIAAARG
jgi:hypothetical protein